MEQNPSWKAYLFTQTRNFSHFMEPDGSGSPSQKPNTCTYLASDQSWQNNNRTSNLTLFSHTFHSINTNDPSSTILEHDQMHDFHTSLSRSMYLLYSFHDIKNLHNHVLMKHDWPQTSIRVNPNPVLCCAVLTFKKPPFPSPQ